MGLRVEGSPPCPCIPPALAAALSPSATFESLATFAPLAPFAPLTTIGSGFGRKSGPYSWIHTWDQ